VLQKIDGKPVVMGNMPNSGTELGKALSSANFQALAPKSTQAQPAAATQTPADPAPANTGGPTKS
jgi:hypothetical protein